MNTIYRKTALFIPVLLLFFFSAFSQRVQALKISGAVLDADSLVFLGGATVKNINSKQTKLANEEGLYSIRVMPGDTLLFQHMTYRPSRYIVPADLKEPQYALVQLLQKEISPQVENLRGFPSQLQFEQAVVKMDPGQLHEKKVDLELNLQQVTNDPTKMQPYIDDVIRWRRLYRFPLRAQRNDLLNADRWRDFIKDWREGRFTEKGTEKLDGYPVRLNDYREE